MIRQLLQPTLVVAIIGSIGTNLAIATLPIFKIVSIGGFMVTPISNPLLPLLITGFSGMTVGTSVSFNIRRIRKPLREINRGNKRMVQVQ
jgi:hypothetical protein